jgi:hypothetical protein
MIATRHTTLAVSTRCYDASPRPRSSGDRATASGAVGRRFESCRGHAPASGSDGNQMEPGVDEPEILSIIGQNRVAAPPSAKHNRGVHDVGCAGHAAELSDRPSRQIVQGNDLDGLGSQQPNESNLTRSIPPHLRDDTRGHSQPVSTIECARHEQHNSTIGALESDQRSCIERRTPHRLRVLEPRKIRSAARRSALVGGPPVSASISSRSPDKSSSITLSASASATYALTFGARPVLTAFFAARTN